jgi:hypothetical protein
VKSKKEAEPTKPIKTKPMTETKSINPTKTAKTTQPTKPVNLVLPWEQVKRVERKKTMESTTSVKPVKQPRFSIPFLIFLAVLGSMFALATVIFYAT